MAKTDCWLGVSSRARPSPSTAGRQFERAAPRGVVGFEGFLGAYSPLLIAAMGPLSRSG